MIAPATPLSNVQPLTLRKNQPHLQPLVAEPIIDSEALLQGQREMLIRHGDRLYRLRHTSNDKLILTK